MGDADLMQIFTDIDVNKDGSLTKEEVRKFLLEKNYDESFVEVSFALSCIQLHGVCYTRLESAFRSFIGKFVTYENLL